MNRLINAIAALTLGAAMSQAVADPGVTPKSILIGQSAAFSGPAMELGTEMRAGALAYFQAINAAGGVNGRDDRNALPRRRLRARPRRRQYEES